MAAKLCMDVRVPASLASALRRRGIKVVMCQDEGTDEIDAADLVECSTRLHRVLFTQDADFLNLGSVGQTAGHEFRVVVFAYQLGPCNGLIVEELELFLSVATESESSNRVLHLPRRS